MKPLQTNQQVLTWLSMHPVDKSTSKSKRMLYIAFTIINVILTLVTVISSATSFAIYITSDIEASLYAVFQFAANIAVFNLIAVGMVYRHRVASIFRNLAKFYATNQSEISLQHLMEANNKSEYLWHLFLRYFLILYFMNNVLTAVASITFSYYTLKTFDVDQGFHPFQLSLPWDQSTPLGYSGEIAFGIADAESYTICTASVMFWFFSICWYHQAFYRIFQNSTLKLNEIGANTLNAREIIRGLIRFHAMAKEWFKETAKVYSPFVLTQLICSMLLMASTIFNLDLQLKDIDFAFIPLIIAFMCGILNLFVYCFFGVMATQSYEDMADCLYDSKWQELPIDLQKYIMLMIQNMQVPMYYTGFGFAILDLHTFTSLIRAVFSYYMLFKTLVE